jgi:hypothetical protein
MGQGGRVSVPLIGADHLWYCPRCGEEGMTNEVQPHTRFHACRALGGLTMPMIRKDTRAHIYLREREDYVGDETVTTVEGRPIMSVVTERDDGQDVAVFAPVAKGKVEVG